MNLHAIVRSAINAVNPDQTVIVRVSTGYTVDDSGLQVPTYQETEAIAQIQPVSDQDLQHLEKMNISGKSRAFYFDGRVDGLLRTAQTGGALIIWNGQTWYVTRAEESWSDTAGWTKCVATLQLDEAVDND